MEYRRNIQRDNESPRKRGRKRYRLSGPVKCFLVGIAGIVSVVALMFGTSVFTNPEIEMISSDFVVSQHDKEQIIAYSENSRREPTETKGNSGNKTPNVLVNGIEGNWETDSVDGFRTAWMYLSNVYETAGSMATVQGHYGCTCTPDNYDVPATYKSSSVAFGPFQADSKYYASTYFQGMVDHGWTEFQQFVGLTNSQYMEYTTRKEAHGAMLKRESENKISFLALSASIMSPAYLSDNQLTKLEQIMGVGRNDIEPCIIGGMFAMNIYLGSGFGDHFMKHISSGMSNEQIVNALYDSVATYSKKGAGSEAQQRVSQERQVAMMMLEDGFNGYETHDIPGRGSVSWGHNMGVPGY